MAKHCIHCGQKGHLLLECAAFQAELRKPSPGTCARCGGAGIFLPYEIPASTKPKRAASVEAVLFCPCCSLPGCPHKRTPVAA